MEIVNFLIIFGGMLVSGLAGWLLGRSDGIERSTHLAISLLVYFGIKEKAETQEDIEKAVKAGIQEVGEFLDEFDEEDRETVSVISDIIRKC